MILLRRVADVALLWLPMLAAIVICCAASAWAPGRQPRPDATLPVRPSRPGEWRGPSVEEVIERLERTGPQGARPADPVE